MPRPINREDGDGDDGKDAAPFPFPSTTTHKYKNKTTAYDSAWRRPPQRKFRVTLSTATAAASPPSLPSSIRGIPGAPL